MISRILIAVLVAAIAGGFYFLKLRAAKKSSASSAPKPGVPPQAK